MGLSNWDEARMQFLLKAMAESTGRQYESAWTKWFSFVDYRDLPPFLSRAGSADDLREEENLFFLEDSILAFFGAMACMLAAFASEGIFVKDSLFFNFP